MINHKNILERIEQKKKVLEEQSMMMFEGGEWTKSAIAYKKAMESTMYGLDPTATKDELLASVPDQYKDHFQAFMNVIVAAAAYVERIVGKNIWKKIRI